MIRRGHIVTTGLSGLDRSLEGARNEKRLIEVVAYHEAGHAVMAIAQGWRVEMASITSPWTGYVVPRPACRASLGTALRDTHARLMQLREVLASVRISLAGPMAEAEFLACPFEQAPGYAGDLLGITALIGRDEVHETFFRNLPEGITPLIAETAQWILESRNWDAIRLVAETLMLQPHLDWVDIEQVMMIADGTRHQMTLALDGDPSGHEPAMRTSHRSHVVNFTDR